MFKGEGKLQKYVLQFTFYLVSGLGLVLIWSWSWSWSCLVLVWSWSWSGLGLIWSWSWSGLGLVLVLILPWSGLVLVWSWSGLVQYWSGLALSWSGLVWSWSGLVLVCLCVMQFPPCTIVGYGCLPSCVIQSSPTPRSRDVTSASHSVLQFFSYFSVNTNPRTELY